MGHIDDMLLRVRMGGLAEIAAVVARQLMPSDDALTEWVRDTSFATLGRLSRRQDTAEGIRRDAAQWLNWILAHAAVNVCQTNSGWDTNEFHARRCGEAN